MDIITILFWGAYFISLYLVIFWLLVFFENGATDKKKQLNRRPFVSIVIPAINEETKIKPTIDSVLKLNYPKDKYEILVVSNASKDRTVAVAKECAAKNPSYNIKVFDLKEAGKGLALNHALKVAKGEIFVVLDADSRVEENALIEKLPHF